MGAKLGQHFLKDKTVLRLIARALEPAAGETIIEIGPGHGELTELLADKLLGFSENKIIAIEKDEKLAAHLEKIFSDNQNIKIVTGDVLKILPNLIENLKTDNWKLVGNIPYYLTGKLLRTIGELKHKPSVCVFMIQKEVAERLAARPPKMNRLSASAQFWAEPKILATVSKKYFRPEPDVDSAVIKLVTRKKGYGTAGGKKYYETVRALFQQPRKTILNNLSAASYKNKIGLCEKLFILNINPEDRPQNISIEEIKKIAESFF